MEHFEAFLGYPKTKGRIPRRLREAALHDAHSTVIATLHNVAEYLDHRGDAADANDVRAAVLHRLGVDDDAADAAFADAAGRAGRGGKGGAAAGK